MTLDSPHQAASGSDVFVSYASQDLAIADAIVAALESNGIRCWIAPRDVKPGAQYADAIVRAINDAKALVLVLSGSAIGSSHVGREIERAASKHKQVIALKIDAVPLTPAMEYFLSESQWIDVLALGMPAALARLTEAVGQGSRSSSSVNPGLGGRGASGGSAVSRAVGTANVAKRVFVAVIVLCLAGTLTIHFWPTKHTNAPGVAAISDKSIAVLPFADMSEKKDQEYFADGIAEEVLDRLAQVPGLKVVGRASSFQFKGKNADLASIGKSLAAAYVLEGSVRKEAGRVRVSAQLMESQNGSQLWSDRFDSEIVDVLNLQDTIAVGIARALQIAVEVDTVPRTSLKSTQALDAYLRGLQFLDRSTREGTEAAVANFQQARSLDPSFGPSAIGLAQAYVFLGNEGWLPPRVAFERAREATLVALRLDPKSPAPHVSMATIHICYDWDWVGADRELQEAFALGPREVYGIQAARDLAAARGLWDQALQLGIQAVALDPLNPGGHMVLGWNVYLHTGRFAEAEQSFRRGLQIAPHWGSAQYFLGEALMLQEHYEAALAEFKKETIDDGQLEGSAMALFAAGRKTESDKQLAVAIRQNGSSWPSEIARVYAFRGEKDRAFEWLNRAYEIRDEDLYVINGDPLFKNLEGDPRYKAFLQKMNLPE